MLEAFQPSAQAWLDATGKAAQYSSQALGISIPVVATLEREMTTIDEAGSVLKNDVITVLSALVTEPKHGDMIAFTDHQYRVDELLDNPGDLTRLFVTRL